MNGEQATPVERATLIASLTELPASTADWARLPAEAEVVEIRADLLAAPTLEQPVERLRSLCAGRKLLFTLRSAAEGGGCHRSIARRRELLIAAAQAGYDWVDIEADRDLTPELLDHVAARQRLLSWHGPPQTLDRLRRRFERMAAVEARLYKLIPAARRSGEELVPLTLLHALGRRDVVAFASGPAGLWSRLVAPRLGAAVVYGATGFGPPAAAGQPTVEALCRDYGLPEQRPIERLFGVVGNPVAHSLSPRLHNGGYRALDVPALYLPFHATAFGDFWLNVVESSALPSFGLPLLGLSVTAPFKDAALAVAAGSSPLAKLIGAANTLVFDQGVHAEHGWSAEATDPQGVAGPLAARGVALDGRAAVVVGAGGAGRSAVVALRQAGAEVTLANRGEERGRRAAEDLQVGFVPLAALDLSRYSVVVHATPVGRPAAAAAPGGEAVPVNSELPFGLSALAAGSVVVDLVYGQVPTALVRGVRERGLLAIDGREVLLHQALAQFRAMTGKELPLELGRQLLALDR